MFTFLYTGKNAKYRISVTSDSGVYTGFMFLLIDRKNKKERIHINNFNEGLNIIADNEDFTFNELIKMIGLELEDI